jgi:hypothetical protein
MPPLSKLGASPSSTAGVPTPSFTLALIPAERPPVGSSVRTPAAGRAFPAVAPAPGSGVSGKGGSPGSGVGTAPGSGAGGDPRAWAGDLAKRGLPVEVTSGVLAGPDGVFARGVVARGARVDPALTGANARGEIWFGPSGQVAAPSDAMIAALDRVEKARRGDPLTPAEWRAHAAFLRAYPGGRSPANPSAPGLAPVMPDFALLALTPLPSGVPEAFFREMRSRTPFGVPYSREAAAVLGSPPLIDFARRVRPEDAAELDRLVQAGNAPPALRVYARYALANTGSMDMVRAVLERGEAGLPQDALPTRTGLPGGDDVARVAEETGLPAQEIARVRQERGVSAQDAANILKSRIFGRWTGTGGAPAGTPPLPPGTGRTGAQAPDPDDLSPEQVAQNIRAADPDVVRKWWDDLPGLTRADLPDAILAAVDDAFRRSSPATVSNSRALTGAPEQNVATMKAGLADRAVWDLGLHPAAARNFVDVTWSKFEDGHRSPGEIGLIFDRFIDRAARFVPGRSSSYLPTVAPSMAVTIRGDLFARLIGHEFGYTVPAALDVISDRTWSDAAVIRAQQAFLTTTGRSMDMVLMQMLRPGSQTFMAYLGQTQSDDPTLYGPIVRRITRGELSVEQALRAEKEARPGSETRKELAGRARGILEEGGSVKIVRDRLTSHVVVDRAQGDERYDQGDLYIHNYGSMMGYVATGATEFWVQRRGDDNWTPLSPHDSVSLEPGDRVRVQPLPWKTRSTGSRKLPDENNSITLEMPPF